MKWSKIYEDGTVRTVDTERDGFFSQALALFLDITEDRAEKKKNGKKSSRKKIQ